MSEENKAERTNMREDIRRNDAIINALVRFFVNRWDAFTTQMSDGTYMRIPEPLTRDVILQHIQGKKTIGIYQLKPEDDTDKWICFDIDPEIVSNPKEVAKSGVPWMVRLVR